jgi:peptidoglycan/LPS O-acetylase OafA/YrhL
MARPADTIAQPVRRASENYPCFDGLRALAAVAVLMHHAAIETAFNYKGQVAIPFIGREVGLGQYTVRMDAGVQIFFLISGFLLYRPFVAAAFDARPPTGPRAFFRRRFLRIYPAYWIAYVVIAITIGLDNIVGGVQTFIVQLFLLQLYDPTNHAARALGGISQSWTLAVEISFYLFIPLYAYVMRRIANGADRDRRFRIEVAGLVVLYAISVVWRAFVFWVMPVGPMRLLMTLWLPAQLDLFAMGMALAVLRTWQQRRDAPTAALDAAGRRPWLWWGSAFVLFTVVTYWAGLPHGLVQVFGHEAYIKQLLYGLCALCLIVPAVFGPQDRGGIRRFLRLPPIVYVGVVSYGVYLWHQAFIKKVHQWGGWAPKAGEPALATFRGSFSITVIVALALSIAVASVSWYLVERPLLLRRDRPLFRSRRSVRRAQ